MVTAAFILLVKTRHLGARLEGRYRPIPLKKSALLSLRSS